jgi:hypothetical protein
MTYQITAILNGWAVTWTFADTRQEAEALRAALQIDRPEAFVLVTSA